MAISQCATLVDQDGQELTKHGTLAFPVAAYDDDLRGASVPLHWHEELEAAVAVHGCATIALGSQRFEIREGEGFFVNSGTLHAAWGNGDAARFHSIVFHARLTGGSEYSVFWEKYITPLLRGVKFLCLSPREDWQKEIINTIEEAWRFCDEEGYGYEFRVRDRLSRAILLIDKHAPMPDESSVKSSRSMERTKAMLSFIQGHFNETLNTKAIAESASVSESECLRCFHNILGTTPIQYLRQFRLEKAERLLTSTELPISEIAARCGFQELSYFSKAFRERNGLTPSEYRRGEAQPPLGNGKK